MFLLRSRTSLAGLRLSGHFLAKQALAPADKPLPAVRERLITLVRATEDETTA